MHARLSKLTLLALVAFAVTASTALAFWAAGGSGSASGPVATLTKPVVTVPSGTVSGDINVSWSASELVPSIAAGNSQIDYTVERSANAGTDWTAACGGNTISGTSCSDNVGTSGNYIYRVTAHLNSWTELSANSASVARKPDKPNVAPNPAGVATVVTITGTAEAGSNVQLYTNNTCTTPASNAAGNGNASGTAAGGSFSIPASVPPTGTTTFWATSTANSLTSDCSTSSASYTPLALGPTVNRSLIVKSDQLPNSTGGFIRASGGYSVYADVTAAPASTISTVSANLNSINPGATNVTLLPCSSNCTVNGQTYSHVVNGRTAPAGLTAGSKSYSITATDNLTRTGSGTFSVEADITRPVITSVSTAGDGDGLPEQGETVTFGYDSPIEGVSLFNTWVWPFATSNVRVNFINRNAGSDRMSVTAGSAFGTAVELGLIELGSLNYVGGGNNDSAFFGGAGATQNSTIQRSGNNIVVTLGSRNSGSPSGTSLASVASSIVTWSGGSGTAYDAAGNVVNPSPASVTSGAAAAAQF